MAIQDLAKQMASWKYQEPYVWRYYLIDWLVYKTSSIQSVSYERVRAYVLKIAPSVTDEQIKDELSRLRVQGIVREKERALGGRYWYVTEEWRENLKEVCAKPDRPALVAPTPTPPPWSLLESTAPAADPAPTEKPAPAWQAEAVQPAEVETESPGTASPLNDPSSNGDIMELFTGKALEELVLTLLRLKGCTRLPDRPRTPYRGTPMDVWAETKQGKLILVECKGWEEGICHGWVTEFVDRVKTVRRQEPARKVEACIVATGDLTHSAIRMCISDGVTLITGLELIRDAVAYGILGIGLRSRRPYVARLGEQGVFLSSDELKAKYGDPTRAVRID